MQEWVSEALASGAKLLCGGEVYDKEHNLFPATLITNTRPDMKVSCEEVFGPIAIIESYKNFPEAIQKANDSKYGLQVGVFTKNEDQINMAFDELEFGGIILNNVPGFRVDQMPYGGVKDSGFGREGIKYTMDEMSELRLLVR
jgi:glyceraldehyde-3-phosphate dehydrogenase (NADP+)